MPGVSKLDWSKCSVVEPSPKKSAGKWVFKGTKVPVMELFETLKGGENIDKFLHKYPTVSLQQAQVALGFAALSLEIP